ncbi:hypothetical protein BRADI_4g27421v3 [Brachypodium distachyon]|uniref:Replication factor A C-terminal domain-containing protein n=1 Tax=Brachypodium distachyon TaxID=15368 RepID=A0A0Q3PK08_BRADI|nr:hypothetical protein BRADI_4g27421v3 [Brachypodium distachyon]PNT64317.1 hypothetical protein BRADI_4g27421v3 [Brachypodium distachyon]PNT64318.1 hypothetical protein BRADI_4g27421v3 [Brachypodium distachyon]
MFRGKMLRLRIRERWWFLSCDVCTSKAFEDCDAYKCRNSYTTRTATPRYKLAIMAADEGSAVEMVFFTVKMLRV